MSKSGLDFDISRFLAAIPRTKVKAKAGTAHLKKGLKISLFECILATGTILDNEAISLS